MIARSLILCGLVASVALVACGDEPAPAAPATTVKKAAPAAAAVAAATTDGGIAEQPLVYSYNPIGKRDPFRSPLLSGPQTRQEVACQEEGPLTQFDLNQLVLVATVTSDANPLGMLEDGAGKGYVVRRNSVVGKMCGRVTQVLRNCITVTEYYPTPDGKRVPNPKELCLKTDQAGNGEVDLETGKTWGGQDKPNQNKTNQ